MTANQIETDETSFTVRRTIQAPLDRVWQAFTDPDEIAQWYHPGPMTTEVDAWELREGGSFDITMVASEERELEDGDPGRYRNAGTFREVEDRARIVHTWRWIGGPDDTESLVTIELTEVEAGTEILLTHTKLPNRETVEDHADGWVGCLENLAAHL